MKSIAMQPHLKIQAALTIYRSYNVQKTGFQNHFVRPKVECSIFKNLPISELWNGQKAQTQATPNN